MTKGQAAVAVGPGCSLVTALPRPNSGRQRMLGGRSRRRDAVGHREPMRVRLDGRVSTATPELLGSSPLRLGCGAGKTTQSGRRGPRAIRASANALRKRPATRRFTVEKHAGRIASGTAPCSLLTWSNGAGCWSHDHPARFPWPAHPDSLTASARRSKPRAIASTTAGRTTARTSRVGTGLLGRWREWPTARSARPACGHGTCVFQPIVDGISG